MENKILVNEEKKTVGFIGGKFLPLHLGHVYAIIEASTQVDELYVILTSSKNRDSELCFRDGIKYIPAEVRLSWLGEELSDLENIKIIHIVDDHWDSDYDWEEGADMIKKAIGKPIDFIFSSENSYNELFKKYYPYARHIVIDNSRHIVPISATEIRKNLFKYWDKLPNCVRAYFTKKVVVIGTESCGKSTLVKKLAKFYNTSFVPEVGRFYCEEYMDRLTEEVFNTIAMEHYLLQVKKAKESNKVLFIDTDATITQYYLDMYFSGKKSDLITEIIKIQKYDLVIFLEPDVKWVDDGLRSAGEEKQRLENNEKLKRMFFERKIPFVSLSGNYHERFNKAMVLVDNLFFPEVLLEENDFNYGNKIINLGPTYS